MEKYLKKKSDVSKEFIKFYMAVRGSDEAVIDLDLVVKWTKKTKGNLKTKLMQNSIDFIKGQDYTIVKEKKGKQSKLEKIKLTVEAFKALCILLHNTEARQSRRDYLELDILAKEYEEE